jgi:hypothetical protein
MGPADLVTLRVTDDLEQQVERHEHNRRSPANAVTAWYGTRPDDSSNVSRARSLPLGRVCKIWRDTLAEWAYGAKVGAETRRLWNFVHDEHVSRALAWKRGFGVLPEEPHCCLTKGVAMLALFFLTMCGIVLFDSS